MKFYTIEKRTEVFIPFRFQYLENQKAAFLRAAFQLGLEVRLLTV